MEDIIVAFHVIILCITAVVIVLSDREAFSWMSGKKEFLEESKIRKHHKFISIGLALMVITGVILSWPARDYIIRRPMFIIKMVFVGMLIANSFFIGKLMPVAFARKYSDLTFREKLPLFVSGAVSFLGWIGATITAFFIVPE